MRDESRLFEYVAFFDYQCETKTGFWSLSEFSRINAGRKQGFGVYRIFRGSMRDKNRLFKFPREWMIRNENNINVEIIGNNITVYLFVMVLYA